MGRVTGTRFQKTYTTLLHTGYDYDSHGRLSGRNWKFDDGASYTESYTYNTADGNLIRLKSGAVITIDS